MANVGQGVINNEPIYGTVIGSKGAHYYVTTDDDGCISCSCPDFMNGKTARGTAIADRVCKHLRSVLAGDLTHFMPRPKANSALGVAEEIKKELEAIEKELTEAKTPKAIESALGKFPKVRERANAFRELLDVQMSEVTDRLVKARNAAQERI